jgi:hypothetical protein
VIQSLIVFPNKPIFRWFQGISHLFKSSWRAKGNAATGYFANGSIEGWKLPQLLLQLIFCINKNVCPFEANWTNGRSIKRKWNVGRVITNSLTAVLELHFCCRMKVLSENAIDSSLSDVINNARTHMSLLRLLKQDLKSTLMKDTEYGGIKHHLVAHLPFYKKWFGADQRTYDTELSEKQHKVSKQEFEHTNKQYGTALLDMLTNQRIKNHFRNIRLKNNDDLANTDSGICGYLYDVVNKFGTSDRLCFVNEKVQLRSSYNESDGINHVVLNFGDVVKLAESSDNDIFSIKWNEFKANRVDCKLVKCLRCYSEKNKKSSGDFVIHCNGCYAGKSDIAPKNICDFIEVKYQDANGVHETEIARAAAIFEFTSMETDQNGSVTSSEKKYFIMLCWMQRAKTNRSVLPYCSYQYETHNQSLVFQIVNVETVIRPAFLVSHSAATALGWSDVKRRPYKYLKNQIFYCLPYNVVIRDHCNGFVEFANDYPNGQRSSSESKGSSSRIYDDLPMMLSRAQQHEISMLISNDIDEEEDDESVTVASG